jgi:twitching motility protein PilT
MASHMTAVSGAAAFPLSLGELLMKMYEDKASDLHIVVGCPPMVRRGGQLEALIDQVLTPDDTHQLLTSILNDDQIDALESKRQIDFAYSMIDLARFRVNFSYERDALAGVFRLIPTDPPHLEETNFPDILAEVTSRPRGLVLVTGPTGSGKSTTLAAMLDFINRHRRSKIVTIEDPVEFMHKSQKSIITQREIGRDTLSAADALRAMLRQDPDVVLIGEMRDLETIALALTAAETGHLVFATLHTTSAPEAVTRIIDVFPPDQQEQVRIMLSTVLEAVFSQTLVPRADGNGRVAALEILIGTPGIRNLIRENKIQQMISAMQTGQNSGMQTLEKDLANLVKSGVITLEAAMAKAANPAEVKRVIGVGN